MATTKEKWQEIANRGLQDRFDPETRAKLDEAVRRGLITTDGVNQSLLYRDTENEEFKEILTTSFKDTFQPMFFTFDNQKLYALSNLERNTSAVIVFDLSTGQESEVLFEKTREGETRTRAVSS